MCACDIENMQKDIVDYLLSTTHHHHHYYIKRQQENREGTERTKQRMEMEEREEN